MPLVADTKVDQAMHTLPKGTVLVQVIDLRPNEFLRLRSRLSGRVIEPLQRDTLAVIWGGDDIRSLAQEIVEHSASGKFASVASSDTEVNQSILSAEDANTILWRARRQKQLTILVGQILAPGAMLESQLRAPGSSLAVQIRQLAADSVMQDRLISHVRIGPIVYKLRYTIVGKFSTTTGRFSCPELAASLVGHGATLERAYDDWVFEMHRRFQEIYLKRPFELNPEEARLWRRFEEIVDVAAYRLTVPLCLRQIGTVVALHSSPPSVRIQWETENYTDKPISFDFLPAEFAAYRIGQRFEAIVRRESATYHLIDVLDTKRLMTPPPLSDEQLEEFWLSIPTTNSLPSTDWLD